MSEENTIIQIRNFFLDHSTEVERHRYIKSVDKKTELFLLELENAFMQYEIENENIINLLKINGLFEHRSEISKVQGKFYLKVYELSSELPVSSDHDKLKDLHNSTYAYLINEEEFEKELEAVLLYKNKKELRKKVDEYEQSRQNAEGEILLPFGFIKPLLKYSSIIAAASILLMLWQPFHKSDSELFNNYINTNKSIEFSQTSVLDGRIRGSSLDELNGLSEIEKTTASEAISLYKKKSYNEAVKAFSQINISSKKAGQLLIFLSISQLQVGDLENAKNNLVAILQSKETRQHDDARFYLSLYYLKANERKLARNQLRILSNSPGKYQAESMVILDKMRWF